MLVNINFEGLLVPYKFDVRQAFGKIVIPTPINYYQNDEGLNFWDTISNKFMQILDSLYYRVTRGAYLIMSSYK